MDEEPRQGPAGRRRPRIETERDEVVIRLPRISPETWNWVLDMIPGRALLRVMADPPEEFFLHSRAARRERLLACRSLIDALIEETERERPRRGGAREVPIE